MFASTWGNPSAGKHVLLIHGVTSSSHMWYYIASEFASRGYFVTAPDLLGHGNARRGSDYTIAALADELQPYLTAPGRNDHPYDIVVGHSLGSVVTSALLPSLRSARPVRVVLCDPPFEFSPEAIAILKDIFCDPIRNPKSPTREVLQREFPSYPREDAIFAWLGPQLCDVAVVEALADQNKPWSFSHLLSTVPGNVKVTVLVADPTKGAMVREEDLKGYPHVTSATLWGVSHQIPIDAPRVIIETALQGIKPQN